MEECDICGRKTEKEYVVDVEGAMMHVCKSCATGMTPIEVIDNSINNSSKPGMPEAKRKFDYGLQDMTEGYGDTIKNAREKAGMTNKDLAIKINEKESLLARIERNQLVPESKVAKKLENALGIKLEITNANDENKHNYGKNEPLTLWDAAIRKETKKKGGE